jgi:hypothetical protein
MVRRTSSRSLSISGCPVQNGAMPCYFVGSSA